MRNVARLGLEVTGSSVRLVCMVEILSHFPHVCSFGTAELIKIRLVQIRRTIALLIVLTVSYRNTAYRTEY